jgi:hypothetical protein
MKTLSLNTRKDINMGTHQIRELLHEYINKADETLDKFNVCDGSGGYE